MEKLCSLPCPKSPLFKKKIKTCQQKLTEYTKNCKSDNSFDLFVGNKKKTVYKNLFDIIRKPNNKAIKKSKSISKSNPNSKRKLKSIAKVPKPKIQKKLKSISKRKLKSIAKAVYLPIPKIQVGELPKNTKIQVGDLTKNTKIMARDLPVKTKLKSDYLPFNTTVRLRSLPKNTKVLIDTNKVKIPVKTMRILTQRIPTKQITQRIPSRYSTKQITQRIPSRYSTKQRTQRLPSRYSTKQITQRLPSMRTPTMRTRTSETLKFISRIKTILPTGNIEMETNLDQPNEIINFTIPGNTQVTVWSLPNSLLIPVSSIHPSTYVPISAIPSNTSVNASSIFPKTQFISEKSLFFSNPIKFNTTISKTKFQIPTLVYTNRKSSSKTKF